MLTVSDRIVISHHICTIRRVVARAMVRQFVGQFSRATAPFQFALQTRSGTEALAHTLRVLTDSDPDVVILSLDGIGAFDRPCEACNVLTEVG